MYSFIHLFIHSFIHCCSAGPYVCNGCPLRRVNQIYVIATQATIDISEMNLPERLNDEYFRRKKLRRPKQRDGDIFESKKEVR